VTCGEQFCTADSADTMDRALSEEAQGLLDFLCDARAHRELKITSPSAAPENPTAEQQEVSCPVTQVSCLEMLWEGQQYTVLRVEGMVPFPPTLLRAIVEHDMFRPDPAITWRTTLKELHHSIPDLQRAWLVHEKYCLPDGSERAGVSMKAEKQLAAHSYEVATWRPTSMGSLLSSLRLPQDDSCPPGARQMLGEFYRLPKLNEQRGQRTAVKCEYTCVIALQGLPREQVQALEPYLAGKVTHLRRALSSENIRKLIRCAAVAVDQGDCAQLEEASLAGGGRLPAKEFISRVRAEMDGIPATALLDNVYGSGCSGEIEEEGCRDLLLPLRRILARMLHCT